MRKILIVDDDAGTRDAFRSILEREGYEIVEAVNGAAALEIVGTVPVSAVVVTDSTMPIIGGVELIHRLRSEPTTAAIPIVVVSSNSAAGRRLQASGLVDATVGKPFTAGMLADRIRAIASETLGQEPVDGRA